MTSIPIFLRIVPLRNPLTLCFCQPVASTSCSSDAPPSARSNPITCLALPSCSLTGRLPRAFPLWLEALQRCPDPAQGGLARLKSLDGRHAGQFVPDPDEARH